LSGRWRPPGLAALSLLQIDLEINHAALVQTAGTWSPCYRIIASEYAGENLFDRLVDDQPYTDQAGETEALREIADLTNAHTLAEMGLIELVLPQDRAYGRGSGLIMAAFAFPGAVSRFSDGTAGTYYAARDADTAISETRYHAEQYLRGTAPCVTEKTLIEADLDGTFLDVREPHPAPGNIYDPADYTAGQALGSVVRKLQGYGILYDSVRHREGECVAVMRPSVLHQATAVQTLQYVWDGSRVADVRQGRSG
jgi:hypothetical protein